MVSDFELIVWFLNVNDCLDFSLPVHSLEDERQSVTDVLCLALTKCPLTFDPFEVGWKTLRIIGGGFDWWR